MTQKTAVLVKANLPGFTGVANLYRCDPSMTNEREWKDPEDRIKSFEYVVASATSAMFSGPETYLFGADEKGKILDWGELPGSFRGGLDCDGALRNAGYEVKSA